MLKQIISGGQTGADWAGLMAAVALGIETGGTAPNGWRICLPDGSDGSNPGLADFGLVEHESRDYPPRTIQNVRDADGTVWFGYADSLGGKLTLSTAKKLNKPCIVDPEPEELRQWVVDNNIQVLNISGNRTSKLNPEIFETVYQIIVSAFSKFRSNPTQTLVTHSPLIN